MQSNVVSKKRVDSTKTDRALIDIETPVHFQSRMCVLEEKEIDGIKRWWVEVTESQCK